MNRKVLIICGIGLLWCGFALGMAAVVGVTAYCHGSEPPTPQFVPVPAFSPLPKFKTLDIPVVVEVKRPLLEILKPPLKLARKTLMPVSWDKVCGPNGCQLVPTYGWTLEGIVCDEPTPKEAAFILASGKYTAEEDRACTAIMNRHTLKQAMEGHWGPGSCGMAGCKTHPEAFVPEGAETQEQLDARTVPWPSGGVGRSGMFGRRRW